MKRKIYHIILALFAVISLNAQVRIGDTTTPNSFSALEIEGIPGGVRVPQLNQTEATALKNDIITNNGQSIARGSLIYNTTNEQLEMWDVKSESWIPLKQPATLICTPPTGVSITAVNGLSFTEFSDTLKLAASLAGSPTANADVYYTWYRDTEPVGIGSTYMVPKEELASFHAGAYTVEAVSCILSGVSTVTSPPVTVTVAKAYSIGASPTANTAAYDQTTYVAFSLTATGTPQPVPDNIYIIEDNDRMYKSHNILVGTLNIEVNKSGNQSPRIMKFQLIDSATGITSDTLTITQGATQGHLLTGNSGKQYFLINVLESTAISYAAAVDHCRSLTWIDPDGKKRASLISEEVLEDLKTIMSTLYITAGSYWLKGKSNAGEDAVQGAITYSPNFSVTVTKGAATNATNFVRCIVSQ